MNECKFRIQIAILLSFSRNYQRNIQLWTLNSRYLKLTKTIDFKSTYCIASFLSGELHYSSEIWFGFAISTLNQFYVGNNIMPWVSHHNFNNEKMLSQQCLFIYESCANSISQLKSHNKHLFISFPFRICYTLRLNRLKSRSSFKETILGILQKYTNKRLFSEAK